ncbi:MAG: S1-like domain-containing RNA-binding protein [Mariprofundus sp.]
MTETGRLNRLTVVKAVDFGLYLDGVEQGEILLPIRYVPAGCVPGDEIEVFIYRDSEDRLIATTEKPYAMVGEFALLQAVAVNRIGAFMNWGLPKDLLVPFDEQRPRMEEGKSYVVRIYIDEESNRIVGSARLDDFLYRESEGELATSEAVNMFIANKSELGYQVIINDTYWGLLHHNEVPRALRRGQRLGGFIKHIREDGLIDLCLHLQPSERTDDICQLILRDLRKHNGFVELTDKSTPADIQAHFGISKAMYKKAVGALYKQKLITLEPNGIRLHQPSE